MGVNIMIYLDNAATSYRKPGCVYGSLLRNTVSNSVNAGRGAHKLSLSALNDLYDASESIAALFGISDPSRIAFTQNATLALNMAVKGILSPADHAVITPLEHNSVLRPVHGTCRYTVARADRTGITLPDSVEAAIRPDTKLVICTHVSNVCGSIQPVSEICAAAHRHNIPVLVDGAQSAGCMPVNVNTLGADMFVFSGHKGLMGPLGTGGIYVREGIDLKPVITGGTGSMSESRSQPDYMPDILQSGTMNTPAIIALGRACKYIMKETPQKIHEHDVSLANMLIEDISVIPGIKLYGSMSTKKRNGTVAFEIKGMPSYDVSAVLSEKYDIATRAGLHCAPLAHEHFGTQKHGLVRASFGLYNKPCEEKALAFALSKIAKNAH